MEKDNKNEIVHEKDNTVSTALAVFIKDSASWHLYKKSEKISKAFFLLTRHLPEEDMIKNHMRERSLDLMVKAQALLVNDKGATEKAYGVVLESLSLISLSDTALAAELQSERNHSIVVRELESFIKDLSVWARERASSAYIPTSIFDMSDIALFDSKKDSVHSDSHIGHVAPEHVLDNSIKKTEIVDRTFQKQIQSTHRPLHATIQGSAAHSSLRTLQPKAQNGIHVNSRHSDLRKDNRQESIIQAVKNRGEVSIKDLVSVIKGCSEKTIQRELISLVGAGILSKTGERRWSRYSVIQNKAF